MYVNRSSGLSVIPEETFPTAILQLEQELSQRRHEGYFTAAGDARIYYEYFLAEKPVGALVFVHGLSEFTKKYYELAAWFLRQGYHVFLYDQRGHGRSHRDTARPELIHINSFDELMADLDTYVETVVRRVTSLPLYLYAHSMGGAVGLLYLAKHGSKLTGAVITSPLIMPRINDLPAWPFLVGVSLGQVFAGKLAKFPLSSEFEPGKPYVPDPGDSANRVRHYRAYREQEPMYRSTPMTLGCAYQMLRLKRRLLRGGVAEAIQTPMLMLCAETDALVRTKYHGAFAKECAACTYEVLTGANHAFHTDRQEILEQALVRILSFLTE